MDCAPRSEVPQRGSPARGSNPPLVWVASSMVEQWTFNPLVLGSNPRRPIFNCERSLVRRDTVKGSDHVELTKDLRGNCPRKSAP